MKNKYKIRYIARFLVEAETPLQISSGDDGLTEDKLICTDINNLPFIPGTSLAGVLRSSFCNENNADNENLNLWNDIFGHSKSSQSEGVGSRLILSSANFVTNGNRVVEGLEYNQDAYCESMKNLATRQHAKMTHRGTADTENMGKYDEDVVYKGARFCFEMELKADGNDEPAWDSLKERVSSSSFRIGGGTRRGFGSLKVISLKTKKYDLTVKEDLDKYLEKSSSLNDSFDDCTTQEDVKINHSGEFNTYRLNITPDDFFIFSSGSRSNLADINPTKEKIIEWTDKIPAFSEEHILIPASSIKGAVSHRVAYHYNILKGNFADNGSDFIDENTAENNIAVVELFGRAENHKKAAKENTDNASECINGEQKNTSSQGKRGSVIISDIYKSESRIKDLNHVSIDRFTGGAIEGALFNEQVSTIDDGFQLDFLVDESQMPAEEKLNIMKAFEYTLDDICTGMLPLGGGVMRGHGTFNGELTLI